MKNSIRSFIAGITCASLVFACTTTAIAAYKKTATLDYPGIKIVVDGKQITPKTANGTTVEPFAIEGTTYLPVRAISNSLGMDVDWDSASKSVIITSGETDSKASDMIKYYKMLEENYTFLYERFGELSSDKILWYTDTSTIVSGSTFGEGMNNANKASLMQMEAWYDHCYSAGYLSDKAITYMSDYRRLSGILSADIEKLQNYPSDYNISSVLNSAEDDMWQSSVGQLNVRSGFWAWYDTLTLGN